jgi:hypothetical protein
MECLQALYQPLLVLRVGGQGPVEQPLYLHHAAALLGRHLSSRFQGWA